VQGAQRARLLYCAVHLLRSPQPSCISTVCARRRAQSRGQPCTCRELFGLRSPEGVAGNASRRHRRGPVHGRTVDGCPRARRCTSRQGETDHYRRSTRPSSGRSGTAKVQPGCAKCVVSSRLYLCFDVVGLGVRRVRHRCIFTPNPRMAHRDDNDDTAGARCHRARKLDPTPRRNYRPVRAHPPQRPRIARRIQLVEATRCC